MRMPWANCACPGSAAAGLSCSELAESFVDGCTGELVRTIELQRDLLLANAGAAAAVGRAAPPWQLAIGALIAAFLIYHHGRGMAWMALSLSLVLFQFTYAVWQMCMIGLDVAMYTFFKNLMLVFYTFDATQRWWRGGSIRRRWRLRRRLHGVASWSVYYKAAHELDSLDGKDAWRDAPGGYAASAVASASRQLAAAREAGDAEELTQLLRTMMMRNHLQVDRILSPSTLTLTPTPTLGQP